MPPPRRVTPPTITDPAAIDDHRARLTALRDRLTAALEVATDRNLAPIARQLQSVLDALAQLPDPKPNDFIAHLQAKRAARMQESGIPEVPARRARVPRES